MPIIFRVRRVQAMAYLSPSARRCGRPNVTPQEVSFINAHGTATLYNDEMESKAIHLAGLEAVPVHSLKPYFGHTLGASGVIETHYQPAPAARRHTVRHLRIRVTRRTHAH